MEIVVVITVEAKDEFEGGVGCLPLPGEVASRVQDELVYSTRGNFDLPWQVTGVRET